MSEPRRLPALDTLRALAILWVFAYHSVYVARPADPGSTAARIALFGNSGVDLFFVLSGFLIARIVLSELRRTGRLDLGRFWWRRWMRTLPAYYAMLALVVAAGRVSPEPWSWGDLPEYLAFVQNYSPRWPSIRFSWSWSLCVEEWFYLLLPVVVLATLRLRPGRPADGVLRRIALAAFLGSIVGRFLWIAMASRGIVNPSSLGFATYSMTHLRLDGLAVGVFLATLRRPTAVLGPGLACAAALAALAGLVALGDRDLFLHLQLQRAAALALIFGALVFASTGENRWARLSIPGMRPIAELSYAIYLTHYTALEAAALALPSSTFGARVALAAALTLLASLAMRFGVELPALAIRDRLGPGRGPSPSPSPPREDRQAVAAADQRSP